MASISMLGNASLGLRGMVSIASVFQSVKIGNVVLDAFEIFCGAILSGF